MSEVLPLMRWRFNSRAESELNRHVGPVPRLAAVGAAVGNGATGNGAALLTTANRFARHDFGADVSGSSGTTGATPGGKNATFFLTNLATSSKFMFEIHQPSMNRATAWLHSDARLRHPRAYSHLQSESFSWRRRALKLGISTS